MLAREVTANRCHVRRAKWKTFRPFRKLSLKYNPVLAGISRYYSNLQRLKGCRSSDCQYISFYFICVLPAPPAEGRILVGAGGGAYTDVVAVLVPAATPGPIFSLKQHTTPLAFATCYVPCSSQFQGGGSTLIYIYLGRAARDIYTFDLGYANSP